MSHSVALIKILPARFVEDFLNGNFYLNTFSYFADLDDGDRVRADRHEGLSHSRHVADISIQASDGSWLPIGGIQNPVSFRSGALAGLNILCLYSMTDRENDSFDPRNLDFGNVAVGISNLPEFVSRIRKAAFGLGWTVDQGPVEYVLRSVHDGYMGPFRKFSEFEYQNEFRFIFKTGDNEAVRLLVGDLRDITYIAEAKAIQDIWSAYRASNA